MRLKCFLDFAERKFLINSFTLSNFNYCPLVWSKSSAISLLKVENLQKQPFRILHNDYTRLYEELLKMSRKATINVRNYRTLCIEIFKVSSNSSKGNFHTANYELYNRNFKTLTKKLDETCTCKLCQI